MGLPWARPLVVRAIEEVSMGKRTGSWCIGALWIALLASGCGTPVSDVYETCSGSCVAGTSCLSANTTVNGFVGSFCTSICSTTNPVCPSDGTGIPPVCVANANDPTTGECYAGCPNGTGCPFAETCGQASGVNFCVP
jgi:hypothetical protein